MTGPPVESVSAVDARRVLLRLQALDGVRGRSGPAAVERMVERLGYVQVDSINVLDRAHDRILATRLGNYQASHLRRRIERERSLFEHWTHDASVIPTRWVHHWKRRFRRHEETPRTSAWWRQRFGPNHLETIRRVLRRIGREGPLRTRDLSRPDAKGPGAWWNWHPEKAAVEHLWRCGKVAIAARENFEKVYDRFERVVPEVATRTSSTREHLDWACREAIARLGIATASEISGFFEAVPTTDVRSWIASAVSRGELVPVRVACADGDGATPAVARPDWRRLADPVETDGIVPLSPFDPVVRDRRRLSRLFDFEYRFEAFTPAAKRRHGYYVLPLLDGDRMIGRIDPRFDRPSGVLVVRGPWWESGSKPTRPRFEASLDRLARELGARSWRLERV